MNYYQEIILLPNTDISFNFLWQKVYQQIHLMLADNKVANNASAIGLSFPDYSADKYCLGKKIRLFAEDEHILEKMCSKIWLNRFQDYVHISQIHPTPANIDGHACFKHVKLKGSKDKLARRRAKRKCEALQQARAYFDSFKEPRSNLPYINMHSETNGQSFRLFIEKQIIERKRIGLYSCYGLSNTSTVPLF